VFWRFWQEHEMKEGCLAIAEQLERAQKARGAILRVLGKNAK